MVSPPVEDTARRAEAPDWRALEHSPERSPQRRRTTTALRILIPALLIVGLFLWRGDVLPAIVLVVISGLSAGASFASQGVSSAIDRAIKWVERAAGRLLSFVLLGAVELIAITPLWLAFRLLRFDPLSLGTRSSGGSSWRPLPDSTIPRYRRLFSDERLPRSEGQAGSRRGIRAALGLVALLLTCDGLLGALLHSGDAATPTGSSTRQSLLLYPVAAAGRGATWLLPLAKEIDRVWYGKHYDPYLGWRLPNHRGRYLHTAGGVRLSYQPPLPTGARAINVYFFGGSTMFGLFQRDGHTIPSDFARLAAADRLPVRVYNFGQLAYNNWQEVQLLQQLLSQGRKIDLAVFYDGANELVSQFRLGPHVLPSQQEASEFAKRIGLVGQTAAQPTSGGSPLDRLYRAWRGVSASVYLWRSIRGLPVEENPIAQPLVSPWVPNQLAVASFSGRDAGLLLARGIGVAQSLARGGGFRASFFLQPFLYSKPQLPGEQQAAGSLGTDPRAWRTAYGALRRQSHPPLIDISDAFDRVRNPIMFDFVHTNELGAAVVAHSLYFHLRTELTYMARKIGR